MQFTVADVTRAFNGTSQALVDRSVAERLRGADDRLVIVHYPSQRPSQLADQRIALLPLDEGLHYTGVKSAVSRRVNEILVDPHAAVAVYTFHQAVLDIHKDLASTQSERCTFSKWSPSAAGSVLQEYKWPPDFMSKGEAVAVLVQALGGRVSAARKSDLRTFLTGVDERFSKQNANARSPGLITLLLNEARSRGVVHVDTAADLVNPEVRLTDSGSSAGGVELQQQGREGETDSGPPVVSHSTSRSQHFINILRAARLGPFSGVRHSIYDELEATVKAQASRNARACVRATVDALKMQGNSTDSDKFPWRQLRDFLCRMLATEAVLQDENSYPFKLTFSTENTIVTGLVNKWRERLDGILVYKVVAEDGDVWMGDAPALAGALLFDRSDQSEEYIGDVVRMLQREEKICEEEDGFRKLAIVEKGNGGASAET